MDASNLFDRYWFRLPVVSLVCTLSGIVIAQGDPRFVLAIILALTGVGFLFVWAHRVAQGPSNGSPAPRMAQMFMAAIHPRLQAKNDDSDIETLIAVSTSICIAVSIAALFLI